MTEIINLRLARKAKARAEAERRAEANRLAFGRTQAEKLATKAEKVRAERVHAAGRIEHDDEPAR